MNLGRFTLLQLIFILGLGATSCNGKFQTVTSCDFLVNMLGQRVSWKNNLPVKMYISTTVPQAFRQSIYAAASEWNLNIGQNLIEIYDSTNDSSLYNSNVIYWMNTWKIPNTLVEGYTNIYWSNSNIYQSNIYLNAQYFMFTPYGTLSPGKVDLTSLLVHEMGHMLGLQHITDQLSVMNPTLAADFERVMPYPIDISNIKCEYK